MRLLQMLITCFALIQKKTDAESCTNTLEYTINYLFLAGTVAAHETSGFKMDIGLAL